MISDTTIIACKGVDAEMKDKFLTNTKIAIPAAVLSMILYAVMSMQTVNPEAVSVAADYNPIAALPYLAVLVLAVAGLDVILVLAIGAVLACVLGLMWCSPMRFRHWCRRTCLTRCRKNWRKTKKPLPVIRQRKAIY